MPYKRKVQSTGSVEVVNRYSVQDVKNNPDKIYVFGDNILERKGWASYNQG